MSLTQLVIDCKALRDALRKRNSDLSTVLSELYSEKSHFIYELLQNAEDAGATWVRLHLLPSELTIKHDGRFFEVRDIDAITGISNTENDKKVNQDKIGRFGIGFKSVFKVTNRPRIQSGSFNFEIEDYIVPIITSVEAKYKDTTITLPFVGDEHTIASTYQAIEAKLQTLESFNLLFLRNLREIQLNWADEQRAIRKRGQQTGDTALASTQWLDEKGTAGEKTTQRYLFFQAPVRHADFRQLSPQRIALAFRVADPEGPVKLIPAGNSFAFVFFETTHKTSLNFLIHAPFVTTPSRENLKMDLAVNKCLLDELSELLRQTLPYFKKQGLLTVATLSLLPLENPDKESNRSLIYRKLFQALKDELSSEAAYLPIINNERYHQPAARLLLAGSRELTTLLSACKQLEFLWPGHTHWLPPTITADATATATLHTYLRKELEIPEITAAAAVQLFTPAFLSIQPAGWMQKFYSFLGNTRQTGLWQKPTSAGSNRSAGPLRTQAFMRLRGNTYAAPFDAEGKAQVFLPLADGQLEHRANCLDPATIDSKPAYNFVVQLGIKTPVLLDEIRLHILPLYKQPDFAPTKKQAAQHFRLLATVYAQGSEKRAELLKLLQDSQVRFVRCIAQRTQKVVYCSYTEAYLPDELLRQHFDYYNKVRFVDEDFYQKTGVKDWQRLLKDSGFKHDQPWVRRFDPKFSEARAYKLRGSHSNRPTTTRDYRLNGLDEFLKVSPFTPELSILAWQIVLRTAQEIKDLNAFYGAHTWFFNTDRVTYFPSSLRNLLETSPWLYAPDADGQEQLRPLTEIIFEELPARYARDSEAALYLLQNLGWKTTARAHLEKQMRPDEKARWDAFLQAEADGIDMAAAIQAQRAKQQLQRDLEKKRLEHAPPLDVNAFKARPFAPVAGKPADIGERQKGSQGGNDDDDAGDTSTTKPGPALRKGIGERGEEVVWLQLQKEFDKNASLTRAKENLTRVLYTNADESLTYELIHGNTETSLSEGCDFLVKKDGGIIRYIEVKATSETRKTAFEVSERQWRVAVTLWEQKRGEQYELWFVHGALTAGPTYTTIINPVERWRNGELGAAPVLIVV